MITIKKSYLRLSGYSLLLINILVFFLTWLQWYIGIPATLLLLLGYFKLSKSVLTDHSVIDISLKTLLLLGTIMLAWTVFSGLGGAFPQKADLNCRNAILHDLINYPWPVRYADGYDSALTYYHAFWLVPALIGKLITHMLSMQAGWIAANIAYTFYCFCILCVVMLLLVSYLKATSLKRMLLVAVVLIFFSGMDIIPVILMQLGNKHIIISTHLEWWTNIQYSSNTTQLFWVFNQAIPAWLVTALLFHEQRMSNYAFLGLILLPYGPLPFVGIFFIMILQALQKLGSAIRQQKLSAFFKQTVTIPNFLAIATLFPIYYFYYSTNTATAGNGFRVNFVLLNFFYFFLFEFLIYALLIILSSYKQSFFQYSLVGLVFIPLFALGNGQDFCMRASIPLLFILMVYIIDYLLKNISFCDKGKFQISLTAFLLITCLALGAVTPLTEFRESYTQIVQSGSNRTTLIADKLGTLGDGNLKRDNFITMHCSDTLFYRYLAKPSNPLK